MRMYIGNKKSRFFFLSAVTALSLSFAPCVMAQSNDVNGIPDLNSPNPAEPSQDIEQSDLSATSADNIIVPSNAAADLGAATINEDALLQNVLESAQQDPNSRQKKLEQQARELAFDAAVNGLLPLKPDEIRELLKRYDNSTEAAQTPFRDAPRPEVTVQTISLDPGTPPPVIKVAPGHVTTLSMIDLSGAPWSIQDVSWGGDFDILQPEEGGHVLRISPLGAYKRGNLSMRLVDLNTPITFVLETHQDVVQYRFDARIAEYGPEAAVPIIDGGGITTAAGNAELTSILDGVPPGAAKKMMVNGVDGRTSAYSIDGKIYLRTPLTLLSPAWDNSVNSVDGLKVYTIPETPVVLLSDNGKVVRASISEAEDEGAL